MSVITGRDGEAQWARQWIGNLGDRGKGTIVATLSLTR